METDSTTKRMLQQYLESLSEKEKKAHEIARDHLGSSFSLEKSIGYIKFCKEFQEKELETGGTTSHDN